MPTPSAAVSASRIRMPMMEKIVQTAKHTVKVTVPMASDLRRPPQSTSWSMLGSGRLPGILQTASFGAILPRLGVLGNPEPCRRSSTASGMPTPRRAPEKCRGCRHRDAPLAWIATNARLLCGRDACGPRGQLDNRRGVWRSRVCSGSNDGLRRKRCRSAGLWTDGSWRSTSPQPRDLHLQGAVVSRPPSPRGLGRSRGRAP